jgi:hypothetical protein
VQLLVMAAGGHREAVCPAADDGDLALRRYARGLGQLHVLGRILGGARREADVEIVLAGDGTDRQPNRPLQRLRRRFLAFRPDRHCQLC